MTRSFLAPAESASERARLPRAWLICLLGALLGGCGSQAGGANVASAEPQSAAREGRSETPAQMAENHCSDGTCFLCGDGLCPHGFYCDKDAGGGPACSWLPACPTKATCACLTKELEASCGCEERDGGAYVSCQ